MLGRVCEPEWLDILGEGGAVVGGLAVVRVVGVEGGRVTRGGLVPKLSVIIIRPKHQKIKLDKNQVSFEIDSTCLDEAWDELATRC